jgi:hypothetical protein
MEISAVVDIAVPNSPDVGGLHLLVRCSPRGGQGQGMKALLVPFWPLPDFFPSPALFLT